VAQADDIQDASKLLKSGQHQQALERVNKVLAAKPKDAQARFLKGLIYAEQGNTKEATDMFLALTKDFPDLPEPYNNLAVIYASQGQYDKARGALEQSIRTHPSYATAYENLGDVYAKLASQAYDKALQIDSANPVAKNKLALVRELVGGATPARPAAPVVAAAPPPKEAARPEPAKPPVVAAAEPKPVPSPEKPVEKPVAAKPANAELLDTVNGWAKAWSSKNVEAYLAYYARDFKTPGGETRADWEKARRARINAPKSITVVIEGPKVSIAGEGQASVTFRQGYRSDVVKSTTTTKTLVLAKSDGRWRIQQERVGH
jgi:tetratricopeptide (TPR) repeat protein